MQREPVRSPSTRGLDSPQTFLYVQCTFKPLESEMLKMLSTVENLTETLELLKNIDLNDIDSAALVPLANAIKNIGAFGVAVHAQIELRAIANNQPVPGVAVKDAIVHRKWHDQTAAEELAQEAFGDKAFSRTLLSPAGIEKLGPDGKAFVAVASYKPEAGKKVVY